MYKQNGGGSYQSNNNKNAKQHFPILIFFSHVLAINIAKKTKTIYL